MRFVLAVLWVCAAVAACHRHKDSGPRIQITYDVDLDKAVDDRASEVKRDLDAQLAEQKVDAHVKVSALEPGGVTIDITDVTKRADLEALIKTTYGSTLAARGCGPSADRTELCFAIADPAAIKKAALEREAATVRARLAAFGVDDATVTTRGDQLVVELPGLSQEKLAALQDVVARTAALAFKVVDNDSQYMQRLYAHVGSTRGGGATDPDAIAAGIEAQNEAWRPEGAGAMQHDYYLMARDREEAVTPEQAKELHCLRPESCAITGRVAIERYVHTLGRGDASFAVPDDRQLVYERIEPAPDAKDRRTYWRSYLVERSAALTGASITNATVTRDPTPGVMLEFDRAGAQRFGELTTRIIGKKLATILDGTVRSAPIIMSPIRGGRAQITVGARDHAADELALVLKTGALPAPLVEASVIPATLPSP